MEKNFVEKNFFGPKIFKKRDFWAKNGEKMAKSKNFGRKNFFGRNRFRMF